MLLSFETWGASWQIHTAPHRFSTFLSVYQDRYDQPPGTASLYYLAMGVRFVICLEICAPINDGVKAI